MIVGLVLAGGRSSRMGEDKAMLRIDGRSLLERAMRALWDAGADKVAISGTRAAGIADRWPGTGPVAASPARCTTCRTANGSWYPWTYRGLAARFSGLCWPSVAMPRPIGRTIPCPCA